MSIVKTEGIVIRSRKYNDDVFITLLAENGPRHDFILKGLVKSRRRPSAAGEPGSLVAIDYYDKNIELLSVKEISLINRFDRLKSHYGGYLAVLYVTELVGILIPPGEEGGRIYLLLNKFLAELDAGNYHPLILPQFKIKLLYYLGLVPREFCCSSCGRLAKDADRVDVAPLSFEIHCGDCSSIANNSKPLLLLLGKLLHETYANMFARGADTEIIKMADKFLNGYLASYLGREPKIARDFYQHLGSEYELFN